MKAISLKNNPYYLLVIGIALFSLTHMSFGIGIIAWFVNVPFLLFLSHTNGWKAKAWFILALITAWSIVILKIISPPMPYLLIFLFSIPISLVHLPAYFIWSRFNNNRWSVLLFPAVFSIMEWIQYTFTPFGSWGVMAYTQVNNLGIMQVSSLFGLAGLSFLIHWINASIAKAISSKELTTATVLIPGLVVLGLVIFGSLRVDFYKTEGHKTMTVAAVGTDSEVAGLPLPSKESNLQAIDSLLSRTKKAADFGAKLIVWNEGSFYALAEEESAIIAKIQSLAKAKAISIFAAYIVPLSEDSFRYENKYVYVNSLGEAEYTYLKHEPVPGEPAQKGMEALRTTMIDETKIGGAICYDYDFPYLAKAFGKLEADIVALPSSDWRGIDPLHSQMAAFRAIEQGHSIIRSTRFGLSAIISPYGEIRAQSSSFDQNQKILISEVPVKGLSTLYSLIGDIVVYLSIGFVLLFAIGRIKT